MKGVESKAGEAVEKDESCEGGSMGVMVYHGSNMGVGWASGEKE